MMQGRTLFPGLPALALAAAIAVNGDEPAPAQPDADTTGATVERASSARSERRPPQQATPAEKRPVRVILPSPYSAQR